MREYYKQLSSIYTSISLAHSRALSRIVPKSPFSISFCRHPGLRSQAPANCPRIVIFPYVPNLSRVSFISCTLLLISALIFSQLIFLARPTRASGCVPLGGMNNGVDVRLWGRRLARSSIPCMSGLFTPVFCRCAVAALSSLWLELNCLPVNGCGLIDLPLFPVGAGGRRSIFGSSVTLPLGAGERRSIFGSSVTLAGGGQGTSPHIGGS